METEQAGWDLLEAVRQMAEMTPHDQKALVAAVEDVVDQCPGAVGECPAFTLLATINQVMKGRA